MANGCNQRRAGSADTKPVSLSREKQDHVSKAASLIMGPYN